MRSKRLGIAVSSVVLGAASSSIAYAKEPPAALPRVWMMGSKFAIPNGSLVDLDRPTPIKWFQETGLRWKRIVTGPHFGCAVSDDGNVYVWSYDQAKREFSPPRLLQDVNGTDVSASEDRVFVLTRKGAVGMFDPITCKEEKKFILKGADFYSFFGTRSSKFVSVSAGRRHVILLDNQGRVWTAGDNEYGQCARQMKKSEKSKNNFNRFDYIETGLSPNDWDTLACVYDSPDVAVSAHSGGRHSVIMTKFGKILAFGDDSKIQLGLGDTRSQDAPDYVPHSGMGRLDYSDGGDMQQSRMFQQFSPAVKYTFYDRHFRNKITEMKLVPSSTPYTAAVLGDEFSILLAGSEGRMICCGENRVGQCGRGFNKQQQTFTSVKLPRNVKPVQVSCGTSHCLAALEDGSVHAWGENSHGQLGVGSRAPQCPPVIVHRSKLRGPLLEDMLTQIGKDQDPQVIEEFLTERRKTDTPFGLNSDRTLPEVVASEKQADHVDSALKQEILAAVELGRAKLMMPEEEQTKFVPILVSASFNNSVLVMQQE